MICRSCGKELQIQFPVGRRDECEFCGNDLHACLQCSFYDPRAYNECRESQADRVLEKDKANFCDYFTPSQGVGSQRLDPAAEAKRKLEALFKKK